LAVADAQIQAALSSSFTDFEDAIQHFAAKADGSISAIITRNETDYSASEIPVLSPDEFLAKLDSRGKRIS
jgi:hypothetical protein